MNIALLTQLRSHEGLFVTPDQLGPDPSLVASDVDALLAFGFAIERHPYLGYAYRGPATRLCPDQVEWNLKTRVIGKRVAVWNRVTSTNDLAAKAASSQANEGLVILAEEQTSGRGSRGRTWTSPGGSSILMSVLLFPPIPIADPAWLTALSAVALAKVFHEALGLKARIKWPNDIRVDGRKVAGILVERGQGTVIGIGINANLDVDDFPEDLQTTATSLRQALGRQVDRSELVREILMTLDRFYDKGVTHGPDDLGSWYNWYSEHYWQEVDVSTPSGTISGRLGKLDLRMGLSVGSSYDQCRQVPMSEVLAIANRPRSARWAWDEYEAYWWRTPPGTVFRSPTVESEKPNPLTPP